MTKDPTSRTPVPTEERTRLAGEPPGQAPEPGPERRALLSRDRLRHAAGPLLIVIALGVIELLDATGWHAPGIMVVLLPLVAVGTLLGGWVPGLITAAIGTGYYLHFHNQPGPAWLNAEAVVDMTEMAVAAFLLVPALAMLRYRLAMAMRERAMREAAEARARLAAIVESSEDAIIGQTLNGTITSWNRRAQRMYGYSAEEAVGQPINLIVPEDRREEIPRVMEKLRRGERVEPFETIRRCKDGVLLDISLTVSPLHDGRGRVIGASASGRDITERKRSEEQVRRRAAQQAAVAELGQSALARDDLPALLCRAVCTVAETLDTELSKVLKLLPGGKALRLEAGYGWREGRVGSATEDAGLGSQGGYTLRSDGPVIAADLRTETRFTPSELLTEHGAVSGVSVIIHGPGGKPWGVLAAHSTERRTFTDDDVNFLQAVANVLAEAIRRRQAKGAMRASERREKARADELATLVDAVPAVVFIAHDPECRRITGSRTACELLRMPEGCNLSQSAPAGEEPRHYRSYAIEDGRKLEPHELPVQRAASGEELHGYEEHVVFEDGEELWLYGSAIPLRDEAGELRGALAAAVDVTEQKRAQEQLQQLNQTLEQRVAERTAVAHQRAEQLRALAAQLTQAEQRERRRLAQILHDHLQQILVAAKMQFGMLRGADGQTVERVSDQLMEMLDEAIDSSRSLSHELSPQVLYEQGLGAALRWLAPRKHEKYGLTVHVETAEDAEPGAEDVKILLFHEARRGGRGVGADGPGGRRPGAHRCRGPRPRLRPGGGGRGRGRGAAGPVRHR